MRENEGGRAGERERREGGEGVSISVSTDFVCLLSLSLLKTPLK